MEKERYKNTNMKKKKKGKGLILLIAFGVIAAAGSAFLIPMLSEKKRKNKKLKPIGKKDLDMKKDLTQINIGPIVDMSDLSNFDMPQIFLT